MYYAFHFCIYVLKKSSLIEKIYILVYFVFFPLHFNDSCSKKKIKNSLIFLKVTLNLYFLIPIENIKSIYQTS